MQVPRCNPNIWGVTGMMRYLDKFRISSAPKISTMRRIYGPGDVLDEFDMHKREGVFRNVVRDVERKYRGTLLNKEKFDSGYCCCLGLLDPIINIRVMLLLHRFLLKSLMVKTLEAAAMATSGLWLMMGHSPRGCPSRTPRYLGPCGKCSISIGRKN
jgi:hypothetical protein